MENESIIAIIFAIALFVLIIYLVTKKTPAQLESLEKQKRIDLGIKDIPEEHISPLDLKRIEILDKIASNTSTIKGIMIFYLILSIIGFIMASIGYSELTKPY